MHALVRFSHIAAADSFTTAEIHSDMAEALGRSTAEYSLGSLRYDLSKLRTKSLVERLPKSRRHRLTQEGYKICIVFLKLFENLCAPLTSGILAPSAQTNASMHDWANSTSSTLPFRLFLTSWSMPSD